MKFILKGPHGRLYPPLEIDDQNLDSMTVSGLGGMISKQFTNYGSEAGLLSYRMTMTTERFLILDESKLLSAYTELIKSSTRTFTQVHVSK